MITEEGRSRGKKEKKISVGDFRREKERKIVRVNLKHWANLLFHPCLEITQSVGRAPNGIYAASSPNKLIFNTSLQSAKQ